MMNTKDVIIKRFVFSVAPLMNNITEIYLFGSRSRADWRTDSDYDILVVVKRNNRAFINRLYNIVMDILFDTGKLISLKIFPESEFNRLKSIPTPFMENIIKEGIRLGKHTKRTRKRIS